MSRRDQLLGSTAASDPARLGEIIEIIQALIASDATVSGVTLFTPDGNVRYIDAAKLRQGGTA
jgi:hypothetical protein